MSSKRELKREIGQLQNELNLTEEMCELLNDTNDLNNEYNICKVAGSSLGVKRSEETKEKCKLAHLGEKHPEWRRKLKSISQGGKNHWQYGKKMPDSVKEKKSKSMIEYYKENQHSMKGKKHPMSNESKQSMIDKLSIPIQQFTKEGEFIRNWKSTKEASKVLNIKATNVTTCLKGKTKTCGGFVWRYKNQITIK
jgi:group I intron endonuclease